MVTGRSLYTASLSALAAAGYPSQTLNAKITALDDINYSDDQLAFLPYYLQLAQSAPRRGWTATDGAVLCSLLRTWSVAGEEYSALYAAIHAAALSAAPPEALAACGAAADAAAVRAAVGEDACSAAWGLRTMQMDFYAWDVDLALRDDFVPFDVPAGAMGNRAPGGSVPRRRRPLPLNERSRTRWSDSPTTARSTGGGLSAADPGMFLLAYHLAAHHGLI